MIESGQQSLQEVIKSYRQSKLNNNSFISSVITNIKKEFNIKDNEVKIIALKKLIFLYLNYCDIQWASFNTLEIMSTCGMQGKLYAYLIASMQFKNNPDFIQLIPNQIRSDLHKNNLNNINSALNCINNLLDHQISYELLKDFESQLNINNNLIRKKIIVSLTLSCEKFAKKNNDFCFWEDYLIKLISILGLKETSNGVSIVIISSIQKICKISPEHCINVFVSLMNYFINCEVNWNLIKIIDIFGMLFKYEPRFTKKKDFIKILSEQLLKSKSKSVEAELIKLIITNFDPKTNNNCQELINLCEERLKHLLFSSDNNLLVLSLKILKNIKNKNKYLEDIFKIVENNLNNSQILVECVNILKDIVDQENYVKICECINGLFHSIDKVAIDAIIKICSENNYQMLNDNRGKESFIWFINIIFDLSYRQFMNDFDKNIDYIYHNSINNINSNNTNSNNYSNLDYAYRYESQIKLSNVTRDLCQRIEIIRDDIIEHCIIYLTKIINYAKEKQKDGTGLNSTNIIDNESKILVKKDDNYFDKIKYAFLYNNNLNNSNINGFNENNNNNKSNFSYVNKKKFESCLVEVYLFIIGEYSSKNNDNKILSNLIDLLKNNKNIIIQYNFYMHFIICFIKMLLKNNSKENIKIIKDIFNDIYSNLNNNDIECNEWINYFNSLFNNNNDDELLKKLKEDYFKIIMNPLADNASDMVLSPKELDLNICLPINEEELNVKTSKSERKKNEKNNNTDENKDTQKNNDSKEKELVKIDTTNYIPKNEN